MLRRYRERHNGFTLIEVIIVVVVLGVLVTLLLPRFKQSAAKSKQAEAKQILKQIYKMQQTYHNKYGVYWDSQGVVAGSTTPDAFAELGVNIGSAARYSYSIAQVTENTFTATATLASPGLDGDPTPDVWTIDQNGFLVTVSDDSVL